MKKIFIAIPNLGTIRTELACNLLTWIARNDIEVHFFSHIQPTAVARNVIVKSFLESDSDFLLMIDADQYVPGDPLKWAEYDLDIIGALCFIIKGGELIPTVLEHQYTNGKKWQPEDGYKAMPCIDGQILEVDATGTGCLMIARRVLERMMPPYFRYLLDDMGRLIIGNDFEFCERAKELGFAIYVDTGVPSAHFSTIDVTAMGITTHQIPKEGISNA